MPAIQAPETMPTASSSRAVGKRGEKGIGVQVLDQRGQHAIGHIGHEPDVVALERLQHDAVPGFRPETLAANVFAPQPPSRSPFHPRRCFVRAVDAPQLDAIDGIVNMPPQARWSAPRGDASCRRCEITRTRSREEAMADGGSGLPLSRRSCWQVAARSAQPAFPDEAGAHFRAVRGRRRRRRPDAHARRRGLEAMGPVGRGRKSSGRRRRDGLAGAGAVGA